MRILLRTKSSGLSPDFRCANGRGEKEVNQAMKTLSARDILSHVILILSAKEEIVRWETSCIIGTDWLN
jgi:hypothetical protein